MSFIDNLKKSYHESEKGLNEEFEKLHTEIKYNFLKGDKMLIVNVISDKVLKRLRDKGFTLVYHYLSSTCLNFPDASKYNPFVTLTAEYKSVTEKLEAVAKDGNTSLDIEKLDSVIEKHLVVQGLVVKPQTYNVGGKYENHPSKRTISFME